MATIESQVANVSFGENVQANDFTLSAFGLPEPPGSQKPGVPMFVWLLGAGLVLVIAEIFWQYRRRQVE